MMAMTTQNDSLNASRVSIVLFEEKHDHKLGTVASVTHGRVRPLASVLMTCIK